MRARDGLGAWVAVGGAAIVIAALSHQPAAGPATAADPCSLETSERVVAIGDIHGAFDAFVRILREASVVDADNRWIGGRAVLVQTGDVMDRGPDSRQALDLLRRLESEAVAAGGQVHALIGNHEAMRLQGILRDASVAEAEAFRSPEAVKLRQKYLLDASDAASEQARLAGQPFDAKGFRTAFLEHTPLGALELRAAFAPQGEYGLWILAHDAMIVVNGIGFMHGGPSMATARLGCRAVNSTIRSELKRDLGAGLDKSWSFREDGPLWYRGLADGTAPPADVAQTMQLLHLTGVVVGHTPRTRGGIKPAYDGQVIPIDTGMLGGSFYPGGEPTALEVRNGRWTAIYIGRREALDVK